MRRVLIVNAVPVNSGDAALVLALYDSFRKYGFEVKIATHYVKHARKAYDRVAFVQDVLASGLIQKARGFKYLLIPIAILLDRHYREAHLILGAPGGYVNSYYSFSHKLFVKFVAKLLGKKTAVYSQSVGPLNERDSVHLSFFLKYLDVVYARDQVSYDLLMSFDNQDKIFQTVDAAFLLEPDYDTSTNSHKVAISVRDWKHDGRDPEKYYSLIRALTGRCIEKGYQVEFLSTCQGVPDYIDDSLVARKIVSSVAAEHRNAITVLTSYHDLYSLRSKLKEYRLVIGTRLHMCILAMLSGKPAFNISYEMKGKQCYSYLGIPELSVDYNADEADAISAFDSFMDNLSDIKSYVRKRVLLSHKIAQQDFERFVNLMT